MTEKNIYCAINLKTGKAEKESVEESEIDNFLASVANRRNYVKGMRSHKIICADEQ